MIAPDEFRRTLGCLAAGVCVATTHGTNSQPVGVTVSSVTSVSLVPPLVLFCLDHGSDTHPIFLGATHWAVSFLAAGMEAVSNRFAFAADPWTGTAWHKGLHDLPLLEGAIASVECAAHARHDGGDHSILVGRVLRARVQGGAPLLYWRGGYGGFTEMAPA